MVVNAKYNTKYSAEYGDYAKVDTEFVSEEVNTKFDHKCNVKEINTRYCSKQAKECPINPSNSLDYKPYPVP